MVLEITLDMAGNMELIAKKCFPCAVRVTDRFHVQKLAKEAVKEIRIRYRWDAIDMENGAIEHAKKTTAPLVPKFFIMGTPSNSFLPGAGMYCIKKLSNGRQAKKNGQRYYSKGTQTLMKLIH